ncbi:MAG: type II secretion system inner membrane protein GspF [Desulfohalobiaceae bacterium]|nr:type II secretion system inner membrane protein GspF [Desulfohalobiaceae bacterium]
MPVYEYTGFDARGKEKKGIVNADSHSAAGQKLRSQGLYPSRIAEVSGQEASGGGGGLATKRLSLWGRVRYSELIPAIRQLATLLSAGLPLISAFDAILSQMKGGTLNKVLARVRERINEGTSLAESLREHPKVFDQTTVALVEAGEESGTLELVMERLADFGEQQIELRRKVLSSLAYPLLMLTTGIVVLFFLMTYVIPKVTRIFFEMEQALPWPTLLLIQVSEVLQQYWWIYIPGVLLLLALSYRLLRTRRGKELADRYALKLPLIGKLVQDSAISRFARTLGTLLCNGVPLFQALLIVRNVVTNSVLAEAVDTVAERVRQGESMSEPLARSGVFPATTVQMIDSGEQSGTLGTMLLKVADSMEGSLAASLSVATSLLEPCMILLLGSVVGFVVIAVLLPIFEMSRVVG